MKEPINFEDFDQLQIRALLIEDDVMMTRMTESILVKVGFTVVTVGSGSDAIAAMTRSPFHLVIVDLHLPDMEGSTLIKVLRGTAYGPAANIVAVTGSDDHVELASAFSAGADDIYQKSIGMHVLGGKLESLANKFKLMVRNEMRIGALESQVQINADQILDMGSKIDRQSRVTIEKLTKIGEDTAEMREVVTAWNQTKTMVTGIKTTASFIKATWWVWAPIGGFLIWLKTGLWTWPK